MVRRATSPADTLQRMIVFVGFHHVAHRNTIATIATSDVSLNSLRSSQAIAAPTNDMTVNVMSE
jgi:hypothetical protein